MRLTILFLIILAELCSPNIILADTLPRRPFPAHTTHAAGTIKPNFPQASPDSDACTFFDRWKADYLRSAGSIPNGTPMYRVIHSKNNPQETISGRAGIRDDHHGLWTAACR